MPVSRRVQVRNHCYENDLDLHENEPVGGAHFHLNGFALQLVLTQAKGNSKITYYNERENMASSLLGKVTKWDHVYLLRPMSTEYRSILSVGCLETRIANSEYS